MTDDTLQRLRDICLALPETAEKLSWEDTPTFRVRDKIFAMMAGDDSGHGRSAVWCKAPPGGQEVLIDADPERFFRPPYVGPKGWIGIRLNAPPTGVSSPSWSRTATASSRRSASSASSTRPDDRRNDAIRAILDNAPRRAEVLAVRKA